MLLPGIRAGSVTTIDRAAMELWERLLGELRQEFQLREDELELLHEIDLQLLKSDRPLKATFDFIVERTQELLESDTTLILLRRGRRLETAYSADESVLGQHFPVDASLSGDSLRTAKTINIADVAQSPYNEKYVPIDAYKGPPLRSLLATPIVVDKTMIGVLNAESSVLGAFKPVHERIISAVAAQVAIALQRAQLFDQNKLFSEVDSLIFEDSESQQVIANALQKVTDTLRDIEHIQLTDAHIMFRKGNDELEIVHSTNPSEVGLAIRIDKSISGRAIRDLQTVTIGDVSTEPEYRRLFSTSIGSEIAIPILLRNSDVVIGVLNVESEEFDAFEGFCQIVLENFADKVGTLLAFAKLRSDVTATMELRNANDLLIAVGDQASNMIHRINNTVGAMRVRIIELQDAQREGQLSDDDFLTESLSSLRVSADKILQLPEEVTRLLNQQGMVVNINDVTETALSKVTLPENVTLELKLDPLMPALSLYSFDIVVENLIYNALDAMPKGGTLSVSTVSAFDPETANGYIELVVQDTGNGISKDILPRVFDLNFTTKHVKGKGHGLGLWWIRNFVLRAKGDITVTSTLGQGSTFVVKVPFSESPGDVVRGRTSEDHEEA
jgi:signal transduction histidine kinase